MSENLPADPARTGRPGTGAASAGSPTAPAPRVLRRLLRNPLGAGSAAVLVLLVAAVLLAPWLAPQDPAAASLGQAFADPGGGHPLGMDSAGRDILSRILYGGRNTLGGALIALGIALVLGVPSGLYAGYRGGRFDSAANWTVDLVMALPAMVVLLASRAILGPDVWALMIVLGVLAAPSFHRLVRGIVAGVRKELYIDAAKVSGLSDARIVARHVLIVVRGPVIIQVALVAGVAIGLQAGLEFLGVGGGSAATWGAMLNEAFQNIQRAPLLMLWPGLALGLTNGALVLLASALRDGLEDRAGRPDAARPRSARRGRAVRAPGDARRPGPAGGASADADDRAELLSMRGLTVAYAQADGTEKEVVHGVDLDVRAGEVVGLVGESGSGKTQTAFAVLGILPDGGRIGAGSVLVGGREVVGLPERDHRALRGRTVAYVPQEPMSNLDPAFTIGSQLMEPMRHALGLSRREAARRAVDLLRLVEIPDPERTLRLYPHQISGGMAQRVLIAGAMSCDPELLIADEPTTALDVRVQAEILALLRRLQRDRGLGVLLVTHDLGVVADLCDRVAVMNGGRIVETGTTQQVLHSPEDPYTRTLLDAVLDEAPARDPWQPREARSTAV
ncbi:putative dipeptide ABC transporter permease and ATP-binding protein [Streptomyces ambofaciens ATCC 23877]|uniref:Putative dipeptide ABC transporter permease and ATP-binding protein n=1 Tax=Streptomyces ambofaciens (strain ATCC 23877 / 3486 / DSM 40053 / JCM 4204 / NBRC 12836 / NRRL B-2516) TaxID=278992 RepID=A0ACN5_STRA7|nr:dipeptide/oligopeptide/nickel ABC transporter permease/ATP-binding protein [Streptomyces ambofaciens]AKZ60103.1 putative dipeptide ABC transporter permease and ATP-binding protein [Streptomyces ambofaciens ATCC 23877]CAJ88240.1 putative dipeptide ABC transporter permease and ATP-binding protein [Streptomyces ambofaciens ATCC 23877]